MTIKHGDPGSKPDLASALLDAFSFSDDFEDRLANVEPADQPAARSLEPELQFHQPFSEEKIDHFVNKAKAEEAQQYEKPIAPLTTTAPAGTDPELAQYQFYSKRLQEKLAAYPDPAPASALKQSANIILYVLQEFRYPIDETRRQVIMRQMERTLGINPLPVSATTPAKPRAPFRGQRLKDEVETLFTHHLSRYAASQTALKQLAAAEEEKKKEAAKAREREKAMQKRQEKTKRLEETSQLISEDKLKILEEELDAMLSLTATNCGLDTQQMMRFGYEDPVPEPEPISAPLLPTPKPPLPSAIVAPPPPAPTSNAQLTHQEIIDRNNERRRLRGLREDK